MPMPPGHRQPIEARIQKWTKRANSGCLEWTGTTDSRGYGKINIDGKMVKASRLLFSRTYGTIPAKMLVLHKCDNPRCVEPAHLFLGTHKDNTQDMLAKGREARGTRAGNAKLTEAQATTIKYSPGSYQSLADKFGVSSSSISRVKNGQCWAHL